MTDSIELFAPDAISSVFLQTLLACTWNRPELLEEPALTPWETRIYTQQAPVAMIESLLTSNLSLISLDKRAAASHESVDGTHPTPELNPAHHFPLESGPIVPGDTPLHVASRFGSERVVMRLIALAGKNILYRNSYGQTAADVAKTPKLKQMIAASCVLDRYNRLKFFNLMAKTSANPESGPTATITEHALSKTEFRAKLEEISKKRFARESEKPISVEVPPGLSR